MVMAINTNVGALAANKQMSQTSLNIQESMQRLASGKRINTSADDAAGVAIASNVNRQIFGNEQSLRNAMDGLSMLQMADSVLSTVTDILKRARTLSVHASNGTLSAQDRFALNSEYQQLVGTNGEAYRILDSGEFNKISLLNTAVTSVDFQIGWEAGDTLSIGTREYGAGGADDQLAGVADLLTQAGANAELTILDSAIDEFIYFRAELGSLSTRFSSIVDTLDKSNVVNRGVRGGVIDADMAKEATELAKNQVLQRSGMGMMQRAEQATLDVMQLLEQLA